MRSSPSGEPHKATLGAEALLGAAQSLELEPLLWE